MKRKLFCSILIAFGLFACSENEIESPAARSAAEDPTTGMGPGLEENENSSFKKTKKTPITQEEFDQIIANTPEGQPIVIERRSGGISIGNPLIPGYHPDLLTFNFVDCDFDGITISNSFQAIVNLDKCTLENLTLTTAGVVQSMEIKRSTIGELRTIDGSHCDGLSVIKSKISLIVNDSGGDANCFRFIGFQ
jgi:hypothetical protein